MIQNRDYNKDLSINQNNLQKEWSEQASIYMYYAEAYADAVQERDERKATLDLIHAEKSYWIMKNWEQHFEKPPSEALRDGWVIRQEQYKIALDLLIKANHSVNLLQGAKTALEHKKKALENLLTLRVTGMYSEPKLQDTVKGAHLGLKKRTLSRTRV